MEKKWIQKAIKHPGSLHKELHVPEGKKISEKKLKAAEKKGGKIAKRAHLAETLKGLKMKEKIKIKMKTAAHKDAKQDKALFGKMMKKEMPKIKAKACK